MVVHSLDPKNDPFRPKEYEKTILDIKISYLSATGVLLYLTNVLDLILLLY